MPSNDDDKIGTILVRTLAATPEAVDAALEAQRAGDPRNMGELLDVPLEDVRAALEVQGLMRAGDVVEGVRKTIEAAFDRVEALLGMTDDV